MKRTHGHARRDHHSPTYESWRDMLKRCRSTRHKYYGARGIQVYRPWESFERFLVDMGERPAGTTLDRRDTNGHYTPDNCRWATPQVQARNQRGRTPLTVNGETLLLSEWAERSGLKVATIWARVYVYEWDPAVAVSLPAARDTWKQRERMQGLMIPDEGAAEEQEMELP